MSSPSSQASGRRAAVGHDVNLSERRWLTAATAKVGVAAEVARTVKNLALGISPWVPHEHRYGLDSITAEELTAAIATDVPGAGVERVVVDRDPRGTTDRARLHLTWNARGREAKLPSTVFAKGTPSLLSTRILNSAFGLCESEVRFYDELQPVVAEVSLTPYVARLRTGGRFAIAVQTFEPDEARFFQTGDAVPLAHAEAMMDALARLHAPYWRSPQFGLDLAWVTEYSRRPGWPIGRRVMPLYNKKWLQKRDDVDAAVKQLTSFYLENQAALDQVWEGLPPTLCHGDTHAGNTYLRATGTAGLFDWQQVHKMHGLRDVTYFLGWSLDPEVRRASEKDLIARYLDGLARLGVDDAPGPAEAFELHRLLMVDAWNSAWAPLAIYGDDEELCSRLLARFVETLLDLDTAAALRAAVGQ